jgi:HK97 family phage portal protein
VKVEVDGNSIEYEIIDPQERLSADQMLHVAGLGGDGITGWSVVKYAAQSIGGGIAADQYAGGQWGNGATPRGVLKHPMRLDKSARETIRMEWDEVHKGSTNAGKIAIMHGGMEFQPISMSNEDAQFLESRQFSIREIARWFRLPPHMLADLADSSVRANIEQQAIEFIVYSLKPWLTRWQQTLNRKLLSPEERKTLYFEFLLESLLQGDSQAQAAAWSVGRQWGWLSVNEIRRQMNLPPVDGGDVYLQPVNMVPADSEAAQGDAPEPASQMLPGGEPEEDEEDEAEDVPESVGRELRGNLAESVGAIVQAAKALREELESDATTLSAAMLAAESRTAATLKDLRSVRDEIRRDLGAERLEQVRGCDVGLVEAAHALLHDNLRCMLKKERAEVLKAARSASSRGQNFVRWLDRFYPAHGEALASRIDGAARAYQRLRPEIGESLAGTIATAYCLRHRQELLAAADGEAAGFVDRVAALADTWEHEIFQIRMGE